MNFLIIFILAIGLGVTAALVALVHRVTHPKRHPSIVPDCAPSSDPESDDWVSRDLTVEGHDKVFLRGWYIQTPQSPRGVVMLLHGHRKDRRHMLRHVPYLRDDGYDLVLMDHRHHGTSDDGTFGFGVFGRLDVACVVRHLAGIPRSSQLPIAALGVSLGATTALAAAADGVPFRAIVADSASANQSETLCDYGRRLYGIPPTLCRLACTCTTFVTGMSLAHLELNIRLENLPAPVLIIHGTSDHKVPLHHAHLLHRTRGGPRHLVTFECGHGRAYLEDADAYQHEVTSFLRQYIP